MDFFVLTLNLLSPSFSQSCWVRTSVLWSHLFSTILGVNAGNTADDALSLFTIGVEERDSFESGDDDGLESAESSELDGKAVPINFRRAARSMFHLRRTRRSTESRRPGFVTLQGFRI